MRFSRQIVVPGSPDSVFAYLADFEHSAEWDPGIAEATRLTPRPTEVGSRFEIVAVFRGNRQRYAYVVRELDRGRRIALHGEGKRAVSDDIITVTATDGGSAVLYEADIRLRGAFRVVEPFLHGTFRRMGDAALDGLTTELTNTNPPR